MRKNYLDNRITPFRYAVLSILMLAAFSVNAYGQKWSGARPDGHAPVGVMGDHTHHAGRFMLSYRYMYMSMDGIRTGTNNVSSRQVLEDYMVAPLEMDMQMHMFGLMYAATDYLSIMGMVPYIKKSMNHLTRMGERFKTESEGFGDIKLTGLVKVFDNYDQRIHLSAGMSFPTGSIDEKDDTPMGPHLLSYPMQLGSGTFDLLPGITYLGQHSNVSWGAQVSGVIRLGENDRDYRLGNRLDATAWGAYDWFNWVSTSARMDWQSWGNIHGADPALDPAMMPGADPDNQGGQPARPAFRNEFLRARRPEAYKRTEAGRGARVPDLSGPGRAAARNRLGALARMAIRLDVLTAMKEHRPAQFGYQIYRPVSYFLFHPGRYGLAGREEIFPRVFFERGESRPQVFDVVFIRRKIG